MLGLFYAGLLIQGTIGRVVFELRMVVKMLLVSGHSLSDFLSPTSYRRR